jgi:hypothetical protein
MTSTSGNQQDLYVDLFSNSSLNLYPDNKVSSFTVNLERAIQLQGAYECALAQLLCPGLSNDSSNHRIIISTNVETSSHKTEAVRESNVLPWRDVVTYASSVKPLPTSVHKNVNYQGLSGKTSVHYAFVHDVPTTEVFGDGRQVVNYIQKILQGDWSNLSYLSVLGNRKRTQKGRPADVVSIQIQGDSVELFIRDSDFTLALSGGLARMLGFGVTDVQWVIFERPGKYQIPLNRVDVDAGAPSVLSVYTNVILPHRVGDTSAPLIRVCSLPRKRTKPGELLDFEFVDLHYLPVALKYIQEINVEVRGNDGTLIPFEPGILYLRLHFRPRRY